MAKKKKQRQSQTTNKLMITLIILLLGALGVQVPEAVQELFSLKTAQVTPVKKEKERYTSTNPGPKNLGKSTFTEEEQQNTEEGWIIYHPLDSLKRATGADALLKPNMVNTGSTANKDVRPPGFISGTNPYNHSRGHLIGRQLGGSGDDKRNLTTLYQTPVNSPFMTKYENQVRAALDQGESIRYRVTPIYSGNDLLCKEIIIEAKGLSFNSTIDFKVSILNER